jgi:hypothetical protein
MITETVYHKILAARMDHDSNAHCQFRRCLRGGILVMK